MRPLLSPYYDGQTPTSNNFSHEVSLDQVNKGLSDFVGTIHAPATATTMEKAIVVCGDSEQDQRPSEQFLFRSEKNVRDAVEMDIVSSIICGPVEYAECALETLAELVRSLPQSGQTLIVSRDWQFDYADGPNPVSVKYTSVLPFYVDKETEERVYLVPFYNASDVVLHAPAAITKMGQSVIGWKCEVATNIKGIIIRCRVPAEG